MATLSHGRSLVLALLGCLLALAPAAKEPPRLKGFVPSRSAWERQYEARLEALTKPEESDALLRELTRTPHLAGTQENERVAAFLARELEKAGLQVEMPAYDVLLSYPRSASLQIVGEENVALARPEEALPEDEDSGNAEAAIPWNAYSPSCDLTAEPVYVNRGSSADYDELSRRGIDVRGKIALARYFGGYRGGKALEAERRGVAAVLVYSDPVDDGWFQGDVYPEGPFGPLSHFQRGANVYDFIVPGDPLTPGWASTPGARRIPEEESRILPKVPMMPLSAQDAAEILRRLGGGGAPSAWQGVAIPKAYHLGPGPLSLRLRIDNTRERRTIHNVIGTLRGTDEAERLVLLSNHHDAWVYGAVDPSSGTAALLSLARGLGALAQQGLRPRRTIVFGSWDAEEYTLTGSTEWGEEHEESLRRDAVVCLNVDSATSGPMFTASASPLLFEAIRAAAGDLPDPGSPGKSLADSWRQRTGAANIRGYGAASAEDSDLPVSILGSGSDYTVFFNRLGIPSTDLAFDGPYGVYHSVYDSYRWMAKFGDPGFVYHAAMARYAGVLALRFANADVLPLDPRAYGREIALYAEELAKGKAPQPAATALMDLAERARKWSRASAATRDGIESRLAASRAEPSALGRWNAWMMSLERALLAEEGIPDRPWFRHMIYAPLPSYEAETLPAIREAILAGRDAVPHVRALSAKIEDATRAAKAAR